MTSWFMVYAVVALSVAAVFAAIAHASRELPTASRSLTDFHQGLRPALVRVRTETDEARARLARRAE
ncbi:MAG: hypothetical protein SGJ13_12970 [Actinomycetota bacterium]|nr:hypothetical protein [Actinomycetota bacterium]